MCEPGSNRSPLPTHTFGAWIVYLILTFVIRFFSFRAKLYLTGEEEKVATTLCKVLLAYPQCAAFLILLELCRRMAPLYVAESHLGIVLAFLGSTSAVYRWSWLGWHFGRVALGVALGVCGTIVKSERGSSIPDS